MSRFDELRPTPTLAVPETVYQVLDQEWLDEPDVGRGITSEEAASPKRNYEGAPAFDRGPYERTVQALTTNTLEGSFYANKKELTEQTLSTLESMKEQDPEFLAKALIHARNEGLMQFVPTVGLAVLSTAEDKTPFRKVFDRIVQTPDNLREFIGLCKTGRFRKGFGGVATDAAKAWLSQLSEYHALKYSGDAPSVSVDGKVKKNNISLRDAVILSRPKPETPELEERLGWLVKRERDPEKLTHNPQLASYERLKQATTDEERISLIKEGRLPWEVVIPAVPKMTPELWQSLMYQMPYFALLRNINNLRKHGILSDNETVQYLTDRLTDPKAIAKAKILPFRLYEAYMAYSGQGRSAGDETNDRVNPLTVDSRITQALEEALEQSFINMPEIPGTVAIGTDVSGSMNSLINPKGQTRYIDIGGIFTGAILKKSPGRVITLPFEEKVVRANLSGQDRLLTTAQKVARLGGGGTALGAPIQELLDAKQSVDTFIGITDNMDWAHGENYYARGSFLSLWREYRKRVNPDAQAFLIRIDPYDASVAPIDEPNTNFIYGWSDQVPAYIGRTLQNKDATQLEEISRIEL